MRKTALLILALGFVTTATAETPDELYARIIQLETDAIIANARAAPTPKGFLMSMNLVPFMFDSHEIRALVDDQGEPWLLAKGVAEALGYENTRQAVRIHCKKAKSLNELGGYDVASLQDQQLTIDPQTKFIPESDVYRLVMRSTLESAERFQDWVVEEVLPKIRKTGQYALPGVLEPRQQESLKMAPLAMRAARAFGFRGNQATLSANRVIAAFTGVNLLAAMGNPTLVADDQEMLLTPTDIELRLGLQRREGNDLLIRAGLEARHHDHKNRPYYELTELGQVYAVVLDTGKKHSDGTPVRQIKWKTSVLDVLKARLQVEREPQHIPILGI